jgi:hypothetical protein
MAAMQHHVTQRVSFDSDGTEIAGVSGGSRGS